MGINGQFVHNFLGISCLKVFYRLWYNRYSDFVLGSNAVFVHGELGFWVD